MGRHGAYQPGGLTRSDAPVLSVDTGSRALGEVEAGQVAGAPRGRWPIAAPCTRPWTRLRGHVREELSAAFRASRRQLLVVAPAFPDAGRLTLGGNQYVHGKLVAASSYGQDPVHPARTSRILDLVDPALGPAIVVPRMRARPSCAPPPARRAWCWTPAASRR